MWFVIAFIFIFIFWKKIYTGSLEIINSTQKLFLNSVLSTQAKSENALFV